MSSKKQPGEWPTRRDKTVIAALLAGGVGGAFGGLYAALVVAIIVGFLFWNTQGAE